MSNLQRGVKYFNAFEPSRPKYIPPGRTVPRRNHPISFLLEVQSERKLTTTKNQNWDKKQYWDKKWKKIETKEYFPQIEYKASSLHLESMYWMSLQIALDASW